jgi:WD40 repeat protein/tRNA A-37 threonylcarbamoyl transferase component Bud32
MSDPSTPIPQPKVDPAVPSEAVTRAPETRQPGPDGVGAAPAPSALVAGYEVLGVLGKGGMGIVYKARHLALQRTVALKMILHADHAGDAERQRFQAEAEAVARLQHPHIVQVYEVGEYQGLPFFSLEFCAGGSLADRLDGKPWPPAKAAELVRALAGAMHAAHQANVVHRDLKPANVLLTADGTPKVTDFGLAKRLDEQSKTQTGAVLGTPSYMAPEQAGGRSREIGPAADVHALGAILYELLTGRPPFQAATPLDILLQVASEEPAPPSQLQRKVPRDLETVCLTCLHKQPGRRYASAAALAEDLGRFLAGEPVRARPVGRLERAWRWCKRYPAVAALLVVSLAFGLTMLVLFGQAQTLRQNEADARRAAEASRDDAEQRKGEAEQAARDLEKANQERKRTLFGRNISLAHAAWQMGDSARPSGLLNDCPPEFRGWEWHYVQRLLHPELLAFQEKDTALLRGMALSPDGKRLATTSHDGKVRIWDATTGTLVQTFPFYPGRLPTDPNSLILSGVAFSPDGRLVAAGAEKNAVLVLDARTGEVRHTLRGHTGPVLGVAFSPDGRRLASCGEDRTVQIWPLGGKGDPLTLRAHTAGVTAVAFSPDGRQLASASADSTVRLWDAATGQRLHTCRGHTQGIFALAYSPDSRRLASTGGQEGLVRIWDAATGQEVQRLTGHVGFVLGVAFSPDGQRLVSTGFYQSVKVWDTATWQESFRLWGHDRTVVAAAFSPDGRSLMTADWFGGVKVWDATTSPESLLLAAGPLPVSGLAFSPDGRRLAVASWWDNTVRLRDLDTTAEVLALLHPQPVHGVAFSPDGKHLATACIDRQVRLWDATGKKDARVLRGHKDEVTRVAFSPDGKSLASGGNDGAVLLWDVATGARQHSLVGCAGRVNGLAYRSDGSRLLAVAADGKLSIWDPASGEPRGGGKVHGGQALQVLSSPDNSLMITSGGEDNHLAGFEWATGKRAFWVLAHTYGVPALAISPDGRRLVSGGGDGVVKVWELEGRQELLTLRGHTNTVTSVAFSPDGKHLASGGEDGNVRLWSADELTPEDRRAAFARRAPAWHRQEAGAAAVARQPGAVVFHTDRLAPLGDVGLLQLRVQALAALGRIAEAEAAVDQVCRLDPGEFRWLAVRAVLRLVAGDAEPYRQGCGLLWLKAMSPFGNDDQRQFAAVLCALAPNTLADPKVPLRVAEEMARKRPADYIAQAALGACLCRAGQWDKAVEQHGKAVAVHGQGGTAFDWLFLAMAHHHLGHAAEARTWLDRAAAALDRPDEEVSFEIPNLPEEAAWLPRLVARVVRREVEGLLRPARAR